MNVVGHYRPQSPMQRGRYVGRLPELTRKTAIVSEHTGGWVIQADDRTTGYGFGWHWFPRNEWEIK